MDALLDLDKPTSEPTDRRIYGVVVAQVINNLDSTVMGRVQLQFPWLPGYQPWARVATLFVGMARGSWFIPMVGDEVLVAFNAGDIREPYVIGCLWNSLDRPPVLTPLDSNKTRKIRTPLGHEIVFDEVLQSVTISSNTMHSVTLDPTGIQLSTALGLASIKLDTAGGISIQAKTTLSIEAPSVTIKGANLSLDGTAAASLKGGATCTIQAGLVKIN